MTRPRVAVIGSGISGLIAAHRLAPHLAVTLFEANDYFGGHAHTVDVQLDAPEGPVCFGVDTGFLVFNRRTYPRLVRLFDQLQVETAPAEMSFSVQVPGAGVEWGGRDLASVFAQPRNLLRPGFCRMLMQIARFNRRATALARHGADHELRQPLSDFLRDERYSAEFRDWYLLPMLGSIWSCPTDQMLRFPVATMVRFCHNHGLIQLVDRPQWYSVVGGARHYVRKLVEPLADARLQAPVLQVRRPSLQGRVEVLTDRGLEHFDEVVFACHADQALGLLADASDDERRVLGAIRYQANRAVLHTDEGVLPQRPRAWAAWNYERAPDSSQESAAVCLHYLLNRLQPLPVRTPVIVSLNPAREPRLERVLAEFDYAHPVFDLAAFDAQQDLPRLQGQRHTWYCGAWTGYGFHEDGLRSGLEVAQRLLDEGQHPAPADRALQAA
ncbi:NADH-ubiquinone oxidoreductase subunit 6 [Caldimonas brevitalea]|uniref:NADH-ubiquinone oxidoreductase subunit 6 n=1 Tax=Caldimonas brevitalea TaxID=413882 RepID=A0A0G3BKC3_9BURK|nr:NADH-ubiquinone oxidoreductase subunit 6 [Caldimonas brevitalea]